MAARGGIDLKLKHRVLVNAYMSGKNMMDAAEEAGYSRYSAHVLFKREDIRHEIERLQQETMAEYQVDREWVTRQLVEIALAGETLAKFKKIQTDGSLKWDFRGATQAELALIDTLAVETTETANRVTNRFKIGVPSRQNALDSLCRIHGLNKDKLDIGGEISLVERLQRGRDRARMVDGGVAEVLDGPD